MKYGLLEGLQEFTAYVLGQNNIPYIPYREDGNWEAYLPKYEPQAENYETSGCTVWGSQNQIETFSKFLYKTEPNYSERFTYLLANVDPARGQDPQVTYEAIRKNGLIDNELMPVTPTLPEFLDKSDLTGSLLAKGQNWLQTHDFKHEWLWTRRPSNALDLMKDALRTCPLGVSVSAWWPQNGKYIDNGLRNNHWCVCYKIDAEGIHVFDSYDHSKKILALDHRIDYVKRIWLNKKTKRALIRHKNILTMILEALIAKQTVLSVAQASIGTDASPSDLAPDELGCAETVTNILKKVYPEVPILTGTWTLWDYLRNPKNGYVQVSEPTPETIIISPTGLGKAGTNGHVGIFLEDGLIASNDSKTGRFIQNHTLDTWKTYYGKRQYPTYLYKRV